MPARRRELKPDTKGRYRPYLGFRVDAKGKRKEHRFNLGTDKKQAERRMERLYDLYDESESAAGQSIWTSFAFYAAKLIEKGTFTIPFPFKDHLMGEDDPAAEYAQLLHVEQQRYPSLHIIPAEPEVYSTGVKTNDTVVGEELKELEEAARFLGIITPRQVMPDQLVTGSRSVSLSGDRSIEAGIIRNMDAAYYGLIGFFIGVISALLGVWLGKSWKIRKPPE